MPRNSAAAMPVVSVRRPFRDNPRLILVGIAILLSILVAILVVADRTARLSPDFLTEVVLYALSPTNVMMLLALGFVLARNVVKLVVVLLGMTLIPAVLVLIVGSRVVLTAVDGWFNQPLEDVLASANQIASDYYRERQQNVANEASRMAGVLGTVNLSAVDAGRIREVIASSVNEQRVGMVQVYRAVSRPDGQPDVLPVVDVAAPSIPV